MKTLTELWKAIHLEEQEWKQKSRVKWLLEKDRNTKFFHCMASNRCHRNFIDRIAFDGLSFNKISEEDRDWLEERFSPEEVVKALDSCDGNKAPGPDGFNLGFVKANWDVIEGDFMSFLEEFYRDGSVVKDLNKTFIALIPKCDKPDQTNEEVVNSVIGESQMAFVRNRQILDSFVIAKEVIHHWKTSKEGGLLVKLDFEKAYDTVDHTFLDDMLKEMGFGLKWRHWVWNCISSPKFSVLVNGKPSREFELERGLRQGDPLSPLLFNVVAEGLNALLRKAIYLNMIKGAVLGNEDEQIFHLQFAEDTIVFL
ncbi:hypothetical protein Ddye_024714 [Dipteronia dyeriana]|uniref:Reverse transcriptase domain-containing protein n=1 Tax=Dipteronia dyeriana TaxID=168575 RepID=A0AAD9TVX9_9ROSI|nr:hypothetical protein Ddye_024714 [Dipteronia dyeriana]